MKNISAHKIIRKIALTAGILTASVSLSSCDGMWIGMSGGVGVPVGDIGFSVGAPVPHPVDPDLSGWNPYWDNGWGYGAPVVTVGYHHPIGRPPIGAIRPVGPEIGGRPYPGNHRS